MYNLAIPVPISVMFEHLPAFLVDSILILTQDNITLLLFHGSFLEHLFGTVSNDDILHFSRADTMWP